MGEDCAPPGGRLPPQDQNHQAAPLRPSGGGARGPGGDCGEPPHPPTPPPPPSPAPPPASGRPEAGRRDSGPAPPRGAAASGGGGSQSRGERSCAPSAVGRPPAHSRITCSRPAAQRRGLGPRRKGGTQECADEAVALAPAWGRRESRPWRGDLSPPTPATLTHRRPNGLQPAPTTAWQPWLNVYTRGGCAREEGEQGQGPRAIPEGRGVGNSGAIPPPSPPHSPRGLQATGAPAPHPP